MGDTVIHGHCDERFLKVKEAFAKNFDEDQELGSSLALSLGGEMVLDLWGGYANPKRTVPWARDTIVQVSSSSKVIVGLCGLMLIDRDLIALDEPVATYWPEFAANGKETLPVRYLFSHSAGLPGLDGMPGWDVMSDFDAVVTRLAAQKPWWEPGSRSGYHGFTYGHLVGELVWRTTGKTIAQFFQDEVGQVLDIDYQMGIADSEISRLATVEHATGEAEEEEVDKSSVFFRAFGYLSLAPENAAYLSQRGMPSMDLPAANGVTNARALAQIGSLLALGGISDGRRILREVAAALPYEEQIYTSDIVIGAPVRYGVGFGISSKELPFPWPNTFHWGGYGGSGVIMVPELGASWAYTPCKFYRGRGIMDHRGERLKLAAITCLENL
jgi:CubicO group peptidase (beta-lactamase class C family)